MIIYAGAQFFATRGGLGGTPWATATNPSHDLGNRRTATNHSYAAARQGRR